MRNTTRHHRGIIFLVAMGALAALLIVGATFIATATQQLHDARRDLAAVHAIAMADAGINYLVWRQKYSLNPLTEVDMLEANIDILSLTPTSHTGKRIDLVLGPGNEDRAAIWLGKFIPPGTTTGFQALSLGYFRGHRRMIRGVLEGAILNTEGPVGPPPQLRYAVFTQSDLYIENSTNVTGDLGSNGNIHVDTSTSGTVNGNLYTAGAAYFKKTSLPVDNIEYGTSIFEVQGSKVTDITGNSSIYVNGLSQGGATAQIVPTLVRESYIDWANKYGPNAFFTGSRLTNAGQMNTPILYVNKANTPGFTLDIDCSLPGPGTIFVNGNVRLNGSTILGANEKPIVIIATGSVTCSGSPVVNGIIWTEGAFGSGTPTVNGAILCNSLAGFKGNVQLTYRSYPTAQIIPPNYTDNGWGLNSWELV